MIEFSDEKYLLKGWSEEDIKKTKEILERVNSDNKTKTNYFLYFIFVMLIILGNVGFSTLLIPLLIVQSKFIMYVIISISAFIIGIFYSLILKEIHSAINKNITTFLILLISFITYFIITTIFSQDIFNIKNFLPPLTYIIFFLIPYFFRHKK